MPKDDPDVYSAFGEIYDRVMRDVDYDSWSQHVLNLAKKFDIRVHKILELACGTGSLALRLASMGYDVTGVERSGMMLELAREKLGDAGLKIPLHTGTMESIASLKLDNDFDLVTCLYDSLNYLLDEEEVERCFEGVYDCIRPGGAFIFDVTTEYNLLHNFCGYTFAENFDEYSYIWENDYDLVNKICTSKVTVFKKTQGRFVKSLENHTQKVYGLKFLTDLLKETGYDVLGMFNDLTLKPPMEKCERIHFVCRKPE